MNDHEFTIVIKKLRLLKSVKPQEDFKARMEKKVVAYTTPSRFAMPFFALRVAGIVFVLLTSGTSLLATAHQSQPGDALYPLKKAVESVKTNLITETEISKAPTPQIKKLTPTEEPELTDRPTEQTKPLQIPRTEVSKQLPTATPQPIVPTPTKTPQAVVPTVKGTVDTVVETLPVKLPLGNTSQPTPTPQPNNVGSKDNGTSAGAGGSLLPKIKIQL